ncbi:MAG TPA: glycosyltransferase family 2 protein [Dehalococcoidia bacterium]|nr:glycosyltransferase family 2 protein [Dehalococcoidia bacterium]
MSQLFLSVVIPTFNEEARIADSLSRVIEYLQGQDYSWEVVVADDGSTDRTVGLVGQAIVDHPNVRILQLQHRGKGWAVKNGMLAAEGEFRLLCDADLSVPIQQIERLLPPTGPMADIVLGSREADGAVRIGEPAGRHIMGRIFNRLVSSLAVPGLADTQCGFKIFRAEAVWDLFPRLTLDGFAFDVELIHLAGKRGLTYSEVGVDWYYRPQSKVRPLRDALAMTLDLFKIRWRHRNLV